MFWSMSSSAKRRSEVREFFTYEPGLWRRLIGDETKLTSLYNHVLDAKRRDFGVSLHRAFFETNLNIGELDQFRLPDLGTLDAKDPDQGRTGLFQELLDRSIFLYGFPGIGTGDNRNFAIRAVKLGGSFVLEYNPIKISILFLSRKQLILHEERLNLFAGRAQSLSSCSIFLKDISVVEKLMVCDFIAKEDLPKHEAHLPPDIVDRNSDVEIQRHALRLILTNRISYDLPIGPPILTLPDQTEEGGAWHEAGHGEPEQKTLKAKRAIAARIVDAKKGAL